MNAPKPTPDAKIVAIPEPLPIAVVMDEVLARYGLRQPRQPSERMSAYRSNHTARSDRELAVA